MNQLLIFFFTISFLWFVSCGDAALVDDCNDTVAINSAIENETTKLTNVLTTFSTDPSTDNCNSLIDAYEDYIDALKGLQACANEAGVGDEFRDSISDAEDSLDTIDCQ